MSQARRPSEPPGRGRQGLQWLGLAAIVAVPLAVVMLLALPRASCACTPTLPPAEVQSPVDGIVIAVDASGLTQVHGFTLRTSDGSTLDFKLGTLENATEFSPSHLAEHQATSIPVRVYFLDQNGERVVYRLEDAPG